MSVREIDWRTALQGAELPEAAIRVGCVVARYGDYSTGRNVRPSNVTIAKELGYTREWVNKMVRTLRKAGWLTPSGRKGPGGVIDYSLTLPDGQEMAAGNGGSSHNLYITTKSPLRGSVDSTTRGLKAPLTETAVRAVSKEESRKAARKAAYAEVVKSYGDMASPDYDWDRWEFAPNVSIEPPF